VFKWLGLRFERDRDLDFDFEYGRNLAPFLGTDGERSLARLSDGDLWRGGYFLSEGDLWRAGYFLSEGERRFFSEGARREAERT